MKDLESQNIFFCLVLAIVWINVAESRLEFLGFPVHHLSFPILQLIILPCMLVKHVIHEFDTGYLEAI